MIASIDSLPLLSRGEQTASGLKPIRCLDELKEQWKKLWLERFDDKVKAEGIAKDDYSLLFVDRGTVISATRDFKPLGFREIVEKHKLLDQSIVEDPPPSVGGWHKFAKSLTASGKGGRRRAARPRPDVEADKKKQQLKKGGRGWLHS